MSTTYLDVESKEDWKEILSFIHHNNNDNYYIGTNTPEVQEEDRAHVSNAILLLFTIKYQIRIIIITKMWEINDEGDITNTRWKTIIIDGRDHLKVKILIIYQYMLANCNKPQTKTSGKP